MAIRTTSPDINEYRLCAGIMLFNESGLVWTGKRTDNHNSWQMPQGGIDKGETPTSAAYRELYEETGCHNVELLDQTDDWLLYDLPQTLAKRSWGGKFRGQAQKWFAFYFKGYDEEFDLSKSEKPEFKEWKWTKLRELEGLIVDFKRPVYQLVVSEFSYISDNLSN
ncbi:MAG: RNA pyrophosphohydrolase [Alphaproteobacteria bacterium]|jgi:putative (di)nucleoside polyphosphate hydrolase|nr:RNA pyrophosphohydrolase [Alphaproteobacteria bacterium]PPR12755.1 MAG: RNA pyrophosphohydrolase [Alphaproteobacteria bacterium MarineAlpha12_Bin1]|tara:strand:- start:1315 stop:1812 length:498 start_codon:yes stop_codon:yes gene_type:complete